MKIENNTTWYESSTSLVREERKSEHASEKVHPEKECIFIFVEGDSSG